MTNLIKGSPKRYRKKILHASKHLNKNWVLGIIFCLVLALFSMWLAELSWMSQHGFSALTLAIIVGIILGNTIYPAFAGKVASGVGFSKQYLLRLGIILYGFRITFQEIVQVGWQGVIIDTLALASTFFLAIWLGIKYFKLEKRTAILIGAGSGICGAAAVMATEPVVRARSEQVTIAVSTVVVFGTLAMFLYPALYQFGFTDYFGKLTDHMYGVWVGASVHEVAQVVAAGKSVSEQAANTAVITKMVRVTMLAPFLMLLSIYLSKSKEHNAANSGKKRGSGIVIPWFAVAFIAVAGFNSWHLLPAAWVEMLNQFGTLSLAMAMGALGLSTHMSAIRQAGIKPLILAAILFIWLIVGCLVMYLIMEYLMR